jgi:hypothetical protein
MSGGGDSLNDNYGSSSGVLLPGQRYLFFYQYNIQAFPDVDGGASAVGSIVLTVDAVVPSPSCGILGLVALFIMRPRRRQYSGLSIMACRFEGDDH